MLTPEQHQQIERYIAGKGIHYYDVQMEITDHLGEQVLAAGPRDEAGQGILRKCAAHPPPGAICTDRLSTSVRSRVCRSK
jgi:hypothetical protein